MKPVAWLAIFVASPLVGALLGASAGPALSRTHRTVALADRIRREEAGLVSGTTNESDAFRNTAHPSAQLYADAARIERTFVRGSAVLGAWLGLVIATKLWAAARPREGADAVPLPGLCVSCGRCFASCPRERLRWKASEPPAPREVP